MTRKSKSTPRNGPDDFFDQHNIPCRHGASCKYLARDHCHFRHPGTPPRVELMTADLSPEPVALPAFGDVDTSARWGIQGTEVLSGFNVLEDGRLAVPGLPPMLQIPKSDVLFENPDEDTSPTRSLPPLTPKFDPLSRALRITRPDISLSDFDLVTTAGCLRRIASFLSYYPQPERLDVEFRGGTLFMGRWEGDPLLNKHHGYGRQFEKKVTRLGEGLERSVSCHLVAGYELGGMKMGVQIEVDAYQCKCHWPPGLQPPKGAPGEKRQDPSGAPGGKRRASSGRFDILSLDTLSLDAEPPQNEAPDGILRLGTPLPLSCAVEIKTRQANSFIDCLYLQQLYFQRTHRVFLGIHDSERFQKKDMDFPDKWRGMKAWEKKESGVARVVGGAFEAGEGGGREEGWRGGGV